MPTILKIGIAAILAVVFVVPRAHAEELIYPGIAPKASAGAGQTVSRGPSAIFYNPANLIFSKFIEPYFDIALAKVDYVYQCTRPGDCDDLDPTVVSVTAPPVTVGLGFRPVPSFALGLAIVPTGTGAEQQIEGVPLEISGAYQTMDIVQSNSGMKLALGAAFRIGHPFTLGAGLIRTSEKTSLIATVQGNEDPLIDALYGGDFNQFIVGARSEIIDRALVLGVSYKTAVVKTYQGDVLLDVTEEADYEPFEGVGYIPASIGFGVEARISNFGAFFDLTHDMWSGGRTVAKSGLGEDPAEVDYVDTNNITVGAKFWPAKKHMLTAAFGLKQANVGDGTEGEPPTGSDGELLRLQDDEEGDGKVGGMQFGNLDGIPRTVVAGGYRYKLSGTGYFELAGQYQKGSRVVPENFKQEGNYSISVLIVGAGIAYGF
jgi:hypothetical protein